MLPTLEEEDAVTSMPLNKDKYVTVRSPDGGLTLFYNTCTLIKIGLEKGGRMMQPPHFREVMDTTLRKEVERLEGVTKIRFDLGNGGNEVFGTTLFSDVVDYSTSTNGAQAEAMFNTMLGYQAARRALHQVSRFDNHMTASQYHVSRTEVYVCPICFEHMLRRCVKKRREDRGDTSEETLSGPAFLAKYTASFDPLDVISTAHPFLQAPLLAFRYVRHWKEHMRTVHGAWVDSDGPSDHRLRDYVARFLSHKNQQYFKKQQYDKGFDTTKWYWDHNGRFNVTRYNRLVAVADTIAKDRGAGYVGDTDLGVEEDSDILVVSTGYDGFGEGQKVIPAKELLDQAIAEAEDTTSSNLLPPTMRYNENCKACIRSINLNHPMGYITAAELTNTAPFADLDWANAKVAASEKDDDFIDDGTASSSSSSSSSATSTRASKDGDEQPPTQDDNDVEDEYLAMLEEEEAARRAKAKLRAAKRKKATPTKPSIMLDEDDDTLLLGAAATSKAPSEPESSSDSSSSSSSSSSRSDSDAEDNSSHSSSSRSSSVEVLEVRNPLKHLMESSRKATPKRGVMDRLGARAPLTPKEQEFIGQASNYVERSKQRDLKRSGGCVSQSTIRHVPLSLVNKQGEKYGNKRQRESSSRSSSSSSSSSSGSSSDSINRALKEYE